MRLFHPLVALPLLAAPPVLQPLLAQPAMPASAPVTGTVLDIESRGEVQVRPDLAVIGAGVVTEAADARTALADNSRRMAAVIAALARAGVAEADIRTEQVSLQPQYRHAENRPPVITGYRAVNNLSVRLRDIGRAGAVLDTLVANGINQINGPDLTVADPAAALDAARREAVATARARARLYAEAAGLTVHRIVAIREGDDTGRPIPVAMLRMEATAADTKIMPGEQTLGVTLQVRFELR
ncbi:DUF541 domain-containing protein [Sphingomonas changnyeongensis]|uniref:DUF541 domain-containing protein n=1 Tax=Sphingomonas changnyeongensis TaxID=2698679 RepID=A0A7Z2S548_9SPHN|nr:SIMPL domain-containing protein [Sphingomonas changnyeongensis]QHL89983.1 DUF541 domain-containing protein [Sphingomonas changnyeongensis]